MSDNRTVRVLNTNGEILDVVDWKAAVVLLMKDRAVAACSEEDNIEIQTVHNVFSLPRVIMLLSYVHIPFSIATPTKRNIAKRDNHTCCYCDKKLKKEEGTIDHVHPKSKGGKHTWTNCVLACSKCNSKKGNRLLSECGMKLKKIPHAPSRSDLIERL